MSRTEYMKSARIGLALLAMASLATGLAAQEEPRLAELNRLLKGEAFSMSALIQAVADPVVDGDDSSLRGISIAAARMRLTGRLDSGFNYLLQTNFAGTPSLLDARVGWSTSPRFGVHAGRFKAPFSRELLTYAGSIDFVNRARAVSAISPGRQAGVQIYGREEWIGWTVGAFNGGSSSAPGEPILGLARLEVATPAASESETRWSVAVAGGLGEDGAVGGRALGGRYLGSGSIAGFDARVESGRLMFSAEWMVADWEPEAEADLDAAGGFLTVGWMTGARSQLLVRADRYRAPGLDADDAILLGWNLWPTSASEIQVNWLIPTDGESAPHKVLVNFQVGF